VEVPEGLRYTSDHEWARLEDGARVRVGLTDFAQDSLGDVVFVQLPELGSAVAATAHMGEVESTKAVSDIYAPMSGKIVEVNSDLVENPGLLNEDPYGEGWLCVIEVFEPTDLDGLLDSAAYRNLITA
jgi:glycine cleavage system H protein